MGLDKLFELTTFAQEDATWDELEIDEDGSIYIPQGSYLGSTLITLGDTYEGHGEDCLFIQKLIERYKAERKKK